MGQVCFWLTCLFTAVSTQAIKASRTLSTPLTKAPVVNTTTLDLTIDPRFGFKADYAETDLPRTPLLMNVVELLSQYAQLGWLSQVKRRHGVVLPEYPQVEIAVLPAAPAKSVEVRLVIWGIWTAIRDVIDKKEFHEAEFEILWEREVVAYIYFSLPEDGQVISSNRSFGTDESLTLSPGPNKTVGSILDNSRSSQASPDAVNDGNFSWKPIFGPTAQTLTVIEVFLTVMAGLKNAAPHAASDKVTGPYASAATDVYANVQFYIHKRTSPRITPPFFQYIHIIESLRLVPAYMLRLGRFSEMFFGIEVDGILVGEGYLEKGHYIPSGLVLGDILEPKDNVSLS